MTFGNKIKSFFGIKVELNDDFFEELTDLLVEGDFGAALAMETVERLEERCKKAKINTASDAKELLALMIKEYIDMAPNGIEAEFDAEAFNVILLLGVNGVGKTTSAAKLAYLYKNAAACKPLLAAGDTFRAAAIDQLLLHGERLDVRVVAHKQHGGAAAVIFDALEAAAAGAYNPVIADTAGRMHTKTALVEELKKIDRVVERFKTEQFSGEKKLNYFKYLVLDATTGSNAFVQAETFNEAVKVDGIILSKMDSSAKGGIVVSLAAKLKLPVLFLATGEKYENLERFNAENFVKDFLE